jgi:hypothetical protein
MGVNDSCGIGSGATVVVAVGLSSGVTGVIVTDGSTTPGVAVVSPGDGMQDASKIDMPTSSVKVLFIVCSPGVVNFDWSSVKYNSPRVDYVPTITISNQKPFKMIPDRIEFQNPIGRFFNPRMTNPLLKLASPASCKSGSL